MRRLAVLALALSVLAPVSAHAEHGTMPRPHWPTGHRYGIPIVDRSGSSVVLQAAHDWHEIQAPNYLVTFGSYTEGGNPSECQRVEGAVVICQSTRTNNPVAVTFGNGHLGACVIDIGWALNDLAGMEHELGHCLGLGEHGSPGGIMGGEGRIGDVDRQALVQVYSHDDTSPPTQLPPPPPVAPPGPAQPPQRACLIYLPFLQICL